MRPTTSDREMMIHKRLVADDSGAFLILWALLLVALMTMVAIVIDLGDARAVRRDTRTIADFAARAAGEALADQDPDPVEACEDAWAYIRTNTKDLDVPPANLDCSQFAAQDPCDDDGVAPDTAPLDVAATNSAPYEIRIRYPVSDADILDTRRSGSGSVDGEPCERMQVTVRKTIDTYFAGVIGIDNLEAGSSATVRGKVELEGQDIPALIILEREACGALQASGQGGIVVKGFESKPGIIAVDSAASAAPGGCTNNDNPGGKAVYGTPLPAGHPTRAGMPSIEALAAESPNADGVIRPPIMGVFAMRDNPGRAAYIVPTGVSPAPEFQRRAGRLPVDARYGTAIANLRSSSLALSASMPAPNSNPASNPAPAPYVRLKSILGNSCNVSGQVVVSESHVYIDCSLSLTGNGDTITFTGTHFVTSGTLSAGANTGIFFTQPELVVVKGSTSQNPPAVDVSGTLRVNGGDPATPVQCEARRGPQFPTTRLVVLNGRINTGAQSVTQLCQTTVYMAELTSPRVDNENNTSNSYITVGGAGGIDWSAPDIARNPPNSADPDDDIPVCSPFTPAPPDCYDPTDPQYELEDLAFWTEAAPLSRVGGSGSIFLTGVFFLPNATFNFDGQAVQNIDRNAQFIARKLDMSGQGTLIMRPDPNDSIPVVIGVYTLIR